MDIRDDRLAESNGELVEIIRGEIAREKQITFARFMDLALAHSTHGYYQSQEPRPGFTGDFLTAPETHPIFGQTLARQMAECWDRLGQPQVFVIREEGAGAGTLARDILDGLATERPDILAATRYELSDVNSARVVAAIATLDAAGYGVQARAAGSESFTGVLLANELLDAFPVHRLVVQNGKLQELYVVWRDGWFVDEVGPLSDRQLTDSLRGLELSEGQRLEVSPVVSVWASQVGSKLVRGFTILIDYGYPAEKLYSASDRFDGTLRTYYQHLVGTDPYLRVGRQDLTAHVNFTAVQQAAESSGCITLGMTSQAYFFAGLGIEELLMRTQTNATDVHDYVNARETVLTLLDPRALGRFQVLVLGKDVDAEPPLRGLSYRL